MKTEIKLITPDLARELLQKNNMNREVKPQIVKEYSRMMSAGLWKEETGEAIKLAYDGTLLDGQQRLNALIMSNIALSFLIISGLDKDIFTVLDTGTKRTSGDVFTISGINNANNISAGLKKYYILKTGRKSVAQTSPHGGSSCLSNNEVLSLYNKKPQFYQDAYKNCSSWYGAGRHLSKSEYLGFYLFFYEFDPDDAFIFFEGLARGNNLSGKDPVKQLRDKLMFSRANIRFRINHYLRTALILKAWNLFRSGEEVKFLKFDIERDNYPVPR